MKCPYRFYNVKITEPEELTVKEHQYLEDCYGSDCPFFLKHSLDIPCLKAKNEVSNG